MPLFLLSLICCHHCTLSSSGSDLRENKIILLGPKGKLNKINLGVLKGRQLLRTVFITLASFHLVGKQSDMMKIAFLPRVTAHHQSGPPHPRGVHSSPVSHWTVWGRERRHQYPRAVVGRVVDVSLCLVLVGTRAGGPAFYPQLLSVLSFSAAGNSELFFCFLLLWKNCHILEKMMKCREIGIMITMVRRYFTRSINKAMHAHFYFYMVKMQIITSLNSLWFHRLPDAGK